MPVTNKCIESLLQLSDTHILPEGEVLSGTINTTAYVDTAAYFRQAIKRASELSHRPLALVITGDLVEEPSRAAYEHFRQIVSELGLPLHLLVGNHDNREIFLDVFPEYLQHEWIAQTGFIQYSVDVGRIRLIALDTHSPGEHHGTLCAQRLEWLEQALRLEPEKPVIVALHHPPFQTGIAHMDAWRLHSGAQEFEEIISAHSQVKRVICGHVHRLCISPFAQTIGMVCSSAAHQIAFQLDKQNRNAVTLEAATGLMHIWPSDAQKEPLFDVTSHALPLGEFDGPYPF